jgi:DNA polymerase-3 subunit gamma/tau
MVKAFNAAAADQRGGWQPSLPLELALAEVIETEVSAPSVASKEKKTSTAGAPPALTETKSAKLAKEEPPAAAEPGITLAQVAKAWKQICAAVKTKNPSLNALLNSAKVLDVKNGAIVLGFASDILRDKVDTSEQIKITQKIINEVLGADVSVKCVVSNAKQSNRSDIKADGMVAAALKHGGEIVDVQE